MKYLGLDLGSKTLGVAISDSLGMIARVYDTFRFPDDCYLEACDYTISVIKKEKIDAVMAVADDAVIMKVYKNFDEVQAILKKHDMADEAVMISRVGLPDETVYHGLSDVPADTKVNYLSTVLAKRKDR